MMTTHHTQRRRLPRPRSTSVGIALVTAALLLTTACGSGPAPRQQGSDGTGDVGGKISIAWWGGESRNAKTNAVIEMFTAKNAGVTTETQSADYANYFDRLNVQASSRSLPCVVQMQDRQLNDYTKRQTLLPLDDMITSGALDVSDIPEAVLAGGRGSDGKLYFLPYGIAWDAVHVNVTMAEEAGVGELPAGYTWDDFTAYLEKAKAGLPTGKTVVGAMGRQQNAFYAWAVANGIAVFGEDGKLGFTPDQLKQYWSMWLGLQEKGITITPDRAAEQPPGADQGYLATGAVMVDGLPGNALNVAQTTLSGKGGQKLKSFRYPDGPAGIGNILVASGFGISANCDNVPTAAAFISYFTNDVEAGVAFAADNGAPSDAKVLTALKESADLPPLKAQELGQYEEIVSKNPPKVTYPPGFNAVFQQSFQRNFDEAAFGRVSIDKAIETFFAETNASLG